MCCCQSERSLTALSSRGRRMYLATHRADLRRHADAESFETSTVTTFPNACDSLQLYTQPKRLHNRALESRQSFDLYQSHTIGLCRAADFFGGISGLVLQIPHKSRQPTTTTSSVIVRPPAMLTRLMSSIKSTHSAVPVPQRKLDLQVLAPAVWY